MLRLTLGLVFYFSVHVIAFQDCVINNRNKEYAWEEQLQKDLSCNYDPEVAPENDTIVNVKYILKFFSFDGTNEIFKAHTWMYLIWQDDRLKWNETRYQGISEFIFSSHEYWTPGLRLLNEYFYDDFNHHYGLCTATSSGFVICVPRVVHEAVCKTRLDNWPYDIQNCTLKFGVWSVKDKIQFRFSMTGAVTLIGAEYGSEWTIIDYDAQRTEKKDTQLSLTFVIEREATGLTTIIIVPTIILTVLLVSTHLLSVKDNLRLGLVTFSLLCHFAFIREINEWIPKHGDDSPTILLYLRASVLLNIILLILTIFLTSLRKRKLPPPVWVIALNNTLLNGYGKYVIQPRWGVDLQDISILEENHKTTAEYWNDFTNIINTICLILVLSIYASFSSFYMPRPSLVSYENN